MESLIMDRQKDLSWQLIQRKKRHHFAVFKDDLRQLFWGRPRTWNWIMLKVKQLQTPITAPYTSSQ